MSQELNANYYTGIKPQSLNARVILLPQNLLIKYHKDSQEYESLWVLEKIVPDQDASDEKFILKYGVSHPYEFLEFLEPDAYTKFKHFYPTKKWKRSEYSFNKYAIGIITGFVGLCVILGIAAYLFLIPMISDLLAKSIPVKWEVELGDKLSSVMIDESLEDKTKSMMLDSFFIMMDVPKKYPIRFHFINDSVVNAFAMPGGNIVIYKGLFDKIQTYESLCGLIGHEFTHVEHKHSLKTIFRSMSSYILLAAFFGDLTGLAGIILENANSIQNLSYSREFEKEADANAVNLLWARKIGLSGMLDLFNVFLSDGKKGLALPKFLSTHPVTEDRIDFVKTQMSQKESDLVHYSNLLDQFNRLKDR